MLGTPVSPDSRRERSPRRHRAVETGSMGGTLLRKNRLVAIATASLVGAAMLPLTAGQVGAARPPRRERRPTARVTRHPVVTSSTRPSGPRSTTRSTARRWSSGCGPEAPVRPRRSARAVRPGRDHGQGEDLRGPRRVRRDHATPLFPTTTGSAIRRVTRRPSTVRCTTRSRSRTAPRTTPRCGRPTTTRPTTRTCTSTGWRSFFERESNGTYTIDGDVTGG